jgi:plasmid stability protein
VGINLSIKGVSDDLASRLRQRAEHNHRSLQGELMAIIEQAAASGDAAGAAQDRAAGATRQGWKTIADLLAERRASGRTPASGLPLSVDIVRADRDSR